MSIQCKKLHKLFNSLPRYKYPFDFKKIQLNGIYILFEKNEFAHGTDRIVRIGTHIGNNLLPSRLRQHFITPQKDGSIFRKNIGRAILNKIKDPYLKVWNLAVTTKESIKKHGHLINKEYQNQIENEVSDYIRQNFTFCVFGIESKEQRKSIESKLISTVSQCNECRPSDNWFGLNSPIEKIRQSGLWLVNELGKTPFIKNEVDEFIELINSKGIKPYKKSMEEADIQDKNKFFNIENKIWVNINKPTKKCTIHTNLSCPYVLSIKETQRKGLGDLKIDGGWKSFNSYIEAIKYCKEWEENKSYTVSTCC